MLADHMFFSTGLQAGFESAAQQDAQNDVNGEREDVSHNGNVTSTVDLLWDCLASVELAVVDALWHMRCRNTPGPGAVVPNLVL